MVIVSPPNWCYSPSKWPKWLIKGVTAHLLTGIILQVLPRKRIWLPWQIIVWFEWNFLVKRSFFRWAMKKQTRLFRVYRGMKYYPVIWGLKNNHCKDPYQTSRKNWVESKRVFLGSGEKNIQFRFGPYRSQDMVLASPLSTKYSTWSGIKARCFIVVI